MVSCCPAPEKLLPAALETVLIGFRVGLLAANAGDQINVNRKGLASWIVQIETDESDDVLEQLKEFSIQKVESIPTNTEWIC